MKIKSEVNLKQIILHCSDIYKWWLLYWLKQRGGLFSGFSHRFKLRSRKTQINKLKFNLKQFHLKNKQAVQIQIRIYFSLLLFYTELCPVVHD